MTSVLDLTLNTLASSVRGWRGSSSFRPASAPPAIPLRLYDIENCPYCRLVREVLSELDLDVMILPCPKQGQRYREEARALCGRTQFPLLVDDNTGTTLLESADIIRYLRQTYGHGGGGGLIRRALDRATAPLATALQWRPGRGLTGMRAQPGRTPGRPLTLFSFEASPYSRPVRARLCELELPYLLRNTAKATWTDMGPPQIRDRLFKAEKATSRNRRWLAEHTGKVQVPYLIDPNTDTALYESRAILRYLDQTYAH